MTACLTGCVGATAPEGATAAHLNDDGKVEILFATCDHEIGAVSMSSLNQEDPAAEDPETGRWLNRGDKGDRTLRLDAPGSGWSVKQDPGELTAQGVYQVAAEYVDDENGTTSATFSLADLEALGEGEVVGFDRTSESRSSFQSSACR